MDDHTIPVPFFGTVEDVSGDPLQLGRVRVRVLNHHDQLDVEDLQWMTVGSPTTSASFRGVGTSPTWLLPGSKVYGMYWDGYTRQVPIVMGTIPVLPNPDDHSVSRLARGMTEPQTQRGPDIVGAPQYGQNKTITTAGGHVIEIDDTDGQERIVVKHVTGSSVAINKDGDVIINSVHDTYHFSSRDYNVESDNGVQAKGKTIKLVSDSTINVEAKGNCTVKSTKKIFLDAPSVSII